MSTGAARTLGGCRDLAELADEELVGEVLAGSRSCFDLLVRRHEGRLHRAVRSVLRDRSEIEDVVQQAFLQAFTQLSGFAGRAAFSTWLTRVALNEALMRTRRFRRVERATLELAPGAENLPETPEQEAGSREAVRRVQAALPRLPPRHRELLHLVLDGLSQAEIAAALGIREGAVKVRVHRARNALRTLVRGGRRTVPARSPRLAVAPVRAGLYGSLGQQEASQAG
jgi:RNA polymerase sigma-70 factor, ECF subfamily